MEVLHMTNRKRETYQVKLNYSLLWECALGIAAITNSPIIDTLEKSEAYWSKVKRSFSKKMLEHLEYVEKNNTWKALLQLLHQQNFINLPEFIAYIEALTPEKLKFACVPYTGSQYETDRKKAAEGERKSIDRLKEISKDNPFFPSYIEYICTVDTNALKRHLCFVMKEWYESIMEPESEAIYAILDRDFKAKQKMQGKLAAEELVEWATGGVTYNPEPSVYNVLLIPQVVYRPWNIEADLKGTKVFYYPVSNESIYPDDNDQPSNYLVNKYKALGDEVRLRIVKLLWESEMSLQAVTNKLKIGKSTVHHHLKILRSAKLVEVKDSTYRLKKTAVSSLAKELDHYLSGE